jgi:hypothetical protein
MFGPDRIGSMLPACIGCGANSSEEPRSLTLNDCPTLRALATVDQHHPDFDPSWAPKAAEAAER